MPQAHGLSLGQVAERCVDREPLPSVHSFAGREVGHAFERTQESRPAIRVATRIVRVCAQEDVLSPEHLRPGKRERQENRIPRGHIGNGDHVGFSIAVPGHRQLTRECRPSEHSKIEVDDNVPRHAEAMRKPLCCLDFDRVSLPIPKRHGVNVEAVLSRQCKRGRRVDPTAEQHHRSLGVRHPPPPRAGSSPRIRRIISSRNLLPSSSRTVERSCQYRY